MLTQNKILHWLQDFYANDMQELSGQFPLTVIDEQIGQYDKFKDVAFAPGMLKIKIIGNPGWAIDFFYHNTSYAEFLQQDIDVNMAVLKEFVAKDWLYIVKKNDVLRSIGAPLYLSVILEGFRRWIVGVH